MKKLLPLAFVSLLVSCASQPPITPDRYYALLEPVVDAGHTSMAKSIQVRAFRTSGLLHDRAIVYSQQQAPQTYQQHHYHFWTDSPSRLVQRHWVNYLRAIRLAELVTDDPSLQTELVLSGRLEHFERQIQSAGASAVVAMEVRVDGQGIVMPLLLKTYRAEVSASGLEMEASISAFEQALADIFQQVHRDLALRQKIGQDKVVKQ